MKPKQILIGVLVFFIVEFQAQNVHITQVTPNPQSVANEVNVSVMINFDANMDPNSLDAQSFKIFGRWSGPMSGNVTWTSPGNSLIWVPSEPFSAGEWVSVLLSKSLSSDEGYALVPYSFNFWIASEIGSTVQNQIEIIEMRQPGEGHIQCYGAYAGDLNDDGYSDLAIVNEITKDVRVMLNDNLGSFGDFVINPLPSGSTPSPSEGADFNGDQIIDIAIGNKQNDKLSILNGLGGGMFAAEVAYELDLGVSGIGIIDANGDGWDDVVSANRSASNLSLLINDGAGDFLDAVNIETDVAGETSIAVVDINNDGLMDVVFGGASSFQLSALIGDGNGGFVQSGTTNLGGLPWMIGAGDLNGDGNVDIATCLSNLNQLGICFGDGSGNFSNPVTYATGQFPLAIDLGDIDGDGDLDVMTSNYSGANFSLYENDGSGGMMNLQTYQAFTAGSCTVLHDRDNDGDLDITGIDEEDDVVILFENPGSVGIEEFHPENELLVFPNPTSGEVSINLTSLIGNDIELKWYKQNGKLISSEKLQHVRKNALIREVPQSEDGIIILELIADEFSFFKKIILINQE